MDCWEPSRVNGACGLPAWVPKPRGDQEGPKVRELELWYYQPIATSR